MPSDLPHVSGNALISRSRLQIYEDLLNRLFEAARQRLGCQRLDMQPFSLMILEPESAQLEALARL